MDAKTLQALKDSIAHWKDNLAAETPGDVNISRKDCALCDLFWGLGCRGCPVPEKTGSKRCKQSPYYDAVYDFMDWDYQPYFYSVPAEASINFRNHFRNSCRAEIAFLESLLPEGAD